MRLTCLVFVMFCSVKWANGADTLSLPEVQILDKIQVLHAFGRNISETDTLIKRYTDSGLGNITESGGIGYLKNYGAGNSAIFSNQGTAAQHSQVIWNGIPCNNSLLGTSDISLMNIGEQNDVRIVKGTTSSYWGGGAIGASLFLRTLFDDKYLISAGAGYHSLGNQNFNLSMSKIFGKTSLYGKMSLASGENSFSVLNYTDPKKNKRSFSSPYEIGQYEISLKQEFSKSRFQVHLLYGNTQRQLSGSLTEAETDALQKDRIGRGVLQYDWFSGNTKITALAGLSYDRIIYRDAPILDTGLVKAMMTKLEVQRNFTFGQLYLILQNKLEQGSNTSFNKNVSRNLPGVIIGFTSEIIRNLTANIEARAETEDSEKPVSIASGSIETHLYGFNIKTYVSGSYNRPSLNDLYWVPGGNRELKPENGINAGITIIKDWHISRIKNNTSLEGFYHNINDWIQWIPTGSIWSPVNYKHVVSSGFGINHGSVYEMKGSILELKLGANFTKALNKSENPEVNFNKQLAYTPEWTGTASVNFLTKKGLAIRVECLSVGSRYTVFDESASLPSYAVVNLFAGHKFNSCGIEFLPFIQLNNLFNQYYESVAYRPREPLNFLTGFKINVL